MINEVLFSKDVVWDCILNNFPISSQYFSKEVIKDAIMDLTYYGYPLSKINDSKLKEYLEME